MGLSIEMSDGFPDERGGVNKKQEARDWMLTQP
jgi:hypothetical protein